jgi:hypothetical protein
MLLIEKREIVYLHYHIMVTEHNGYPLDVIDLVYLHHTIVNTMKETYY